MGSPLFKIPVSLIPPSSGSCGLDTVDWYQSKLNHTHDMDVCQDFLFREVLAFDDWAGMAESIEAGCIENSSHGEPLCWLENDFVTNCPFTAKDGLRMLEKLSDDYSLEFETHQLISVLHHLYLMYRKNEVVNLTSIRSMPDGLILHAFDSLLFAKVISKYEKLDDQLRLLDMGTGGGFPGIPIACVSNYDVELLDSVGKKVNACNEFASEIGLDNRVHASHNRLEEFVRQSGRCFDIVTARALAKLDILIEYAEPYVKQGGYLFFGKANPEKQELADASKVAKLCGFEIVSRETFELPDDYGHREIVVLKKVAKSKVRLPRKNGEARNHPLSAR